jgi:hypothetical protein
MVILASIYLRFYIQAGVKVGTFLPTQTPPKIPSDSDSTALEGTLQSQSGQSAKRKISTTTRNLTPILQSSSP